MVVIARRVFYVLLWMESPRWLVQGVRGVLGKLENSSVQADKLCGCRHSLLDVYWKATNSNFVWRMPLVARGVKLTSGCCPEHSTTKKMRGSVYVPGGPILFWRCNRDL